ncbi:phage tail tube protein [Pseudomonas putida]|uniref:phage tail tube protein n=1 Tax=Pseudomonas putida TaxID=303 RepID=UPI0018E6A9ED|nr:phage tail tube protein [Pseudomonas putida]MBI6944202.1 phage tail tube protein [Pseudomonas putida]MBI6960303.1 phage tail tube protein [Pseudomonas putida]
MTALAGTATITADGATYMLVGDLSYDPSTVAREELTGQDGTHGYKEKPKFGQIKATLRDTGSLTIADLNAMSNVTVVLDLANGKTVLGRNMFTVDPQSVSTEEGTVEVTWKGQVSETPA